MAQLPLGGSHESIEETATTTATSREFPYHIEVWIHLANDGPNDLRLGFDRPISAGEYVTLKPGERLLNVERRTLVLYWQSVGGDTAFRAFGLRR